MAAITASRLAPAVAQHRVSGAQGFGQRGSGLLLALRRSARRTGDGAGPRLWYMTIPHSTRRSGTGASGAEHDRQLRSTTIVIIAAAERRTEAVHRRSNAGPHRVIVRP